MITASTLLSSSFLNGLCYITQKADGVPKKMVFNSRFHFFLKPASLANSASSNKLEITSVFAEYCRIHADATAISTAIEVLFIYDYHSKNRTINNLNKKEKLDLLRKEHNYITYNNPYDEENIEKYMEYERSQFTKFIQLSGNVQMIWWPKKYFTIPIENRLEILSKYMDIYLPKLNFIKNDGFIIETENETFKLKTRADTTIDLVYKNNAFYSRENYIVENVLVQPKKLELVSNKVYRCYFNEEMNIWEPRERRYDKKQANPNEIVAIYQNYQKNPFTIEDIIQVYNTGNYYNNDEYKIKSYRNKGRFLLKDEIVGKVLDIGCGYKFLNKSINNSKTDYYGIDNDYKVNTYAKENDIANIYNVDFTLGKWNNDIQKSRYKYDLYSQLVNKNESEFPTEIAFDNILLFYSIHYAGNSVEKLNYLIKNIKAISKKGTSVYIAYLDKDLLLKLFSGARDTNVITTNVITNVITNGVSYVKLMNEMNEEMIPIKYYYSWVHKTPRIEYCYSSHYIIENFKKYGFELEYIKPKNNITSPSRSSWDRYFNCFNLIKLNC